jgi:hypothetical protein
MRYYESVFYLFHKKNPACPVTFKIFSGILGKGETNSLAL